VAVVEHIQFVVVVVERNKVVVDHIEVDHKIVVHNLVVVGHMIVGEENNIEVVVDRILYCFDPFLII
jgi:hypothetical protein